MEIALKVNEMEKPISGPLFVKFSRYKQVLNTVDYIKSDISAIKTSAAALRELNKSRREARIILLDLSRLLETNINWVESELLNVGKIELEKPKIEELKEKIVSPFKELQKITTIIPSLFKKSTQEKIPEPKPVEETPVKIEEKKPEEIIPKIETPLIEQKPIELPIKIPEVEIKEEKIQPIETVKEIKKQITKPKKKKELPELSVLEEKKPKEMIPKLEIPLPEETEFKKEEITPRKPEEKLEKEIKKTKQKKVDLSDLFKTLEKKVEEITPKIGKVFEPKPEEKVPVKTEVERQELKAVKSLKVSDSEVKEAIEKIDELEKRIPEKVTDSNQVEELKQMITRLESGVNRERLVIIPQVIDRLLTARERISQLEFSSGMRRPSKISALKKRVEELESKKQQLIEAKEIVKKKFYEGEIDEDTLRNIVESYEQKTVETEVELAHSKKQLEEAQEKGDEELTEEMPAEATSYRPSVVEVEPMRPPIVKKPGVSLMRPIKLPTDDFPEKSKGEFRRSILPTLQKTEESIKQVAKIQTHLDKILEIVNGEGFVSIGDLAKVLNIRENQIEEWGKLLEERDLLSLYYPPIGKPILRKIK